MLLDSAEFRSSLPTTISESKDVVSQEALTFFSTRHMTIMRGNDIKDCRFEGGDVDMLSRMGMDEICGRMSG